MTPIQKAKEIAVAFATHYSQQTRTNPPQEFDAWIKTPEAAALLSDWKEDGMPLPELIEETWDSHSQLIGSDIDDLDYWAGREAMKVIDFEKAVNEIVDKLKPMSGLK